MTPGLVQEDGEPYVQGFRDGWNKGYQDGIEATRETIQHIIDTSGYGYVSWRDVLANIDGLAKKPARPR